MMFNNIITKLIPFRKIYHPYHHYTIRMSSFPPSSLASFTSSPSSSVILQENCKCDYHNGLCSNVHHHPSINQYRQTLRSITRCSVPHHFHHRIKIQHHPIKLPYRNISASVQYKQQSDERMAKLLSGKEVSDEIRAKLKEDVKGLKVKPVLAIMQVGGREDSNVYIRMKKNYIESIGGSSRHVQLPRTTTQEELASEVSKLNSDSEIHGIIIQLPLDSEKPIDAHYVTNLISPEKDVDGLTVANAGNLLHGKITGNEGFIPCTPFGCMELIKKSGVKIEGSQAVVLGRSKIVGSPMAQLLIWNNATVTVCHSRTKNLPEIVRSAEILVVAIGKPLFVKKDWIKPGAVVIDCGISSIPDSTKKSGQRLVGDVDFDGCKEVASYITPVPGGVGPMTVAMLITNTVISATRCQPKSENGH